MVVVIDGENLLLGRMCSLVSQRILAGDEIAIINAEKVIISGSRAVVMEEYYSKRVRGSVEGGPFFPRRPDQIVKRTIRGMIPYKTKQGAAAFRRVKAYVGVPYEFKGIETETLDSAHCNRLSRASYITIGAISTNLGARY